MSKNGGPAFPVNELHGDGCSLYARHFGMTLRDAFAIAAMPQIYGRAESGGFERVAKLSYELADEMLRAREMTA